MQQWKYYWFSTKSDQPPHQTLKLGKDKREVRIDEFMDELGQKGWELVAVTQLLHNALTYGLVYYFKRPVIDAVQPPENLQPPS